MTRALDAVGKAHEVALEALASSVEPGPKYYATTNALISTESKGDINVYIIELGSIGHSGNEHLTALNKKISSYISTLEELLENGHLKPQDYEVIGKGFPGVEEGYDALNAGSRVGKKILVRLADD